MSRRAGTGTMVPAGLVVDRVEVEPGGVLVFVRPSSKSAICPRCGGASRSIHSRYERRLADLPAHGRRVQLRVQVRRFRCAWAECPQKIFAERLDPSVAHPFGRRTGRLEGIVHHIGVALGGRPGQRTAARLLLPVSKDTLLRIVRDRAVGATPSPKVIGIDDWAWRKGHRYGTIVCDLERRRIIDVLPDRETATVQAWLAARPSIELIARDPMKDLGWQLRPGGGAGPAGGAAGRRPLASDGECERGVSCGRAPVHARHPQGGRPRPH
jgi:transposase